MIDLNDKNYNLNIDNISVPFIIYIYSNNCPHCITVKEYLNIIENDKNKPCSFKIFSVNGEKSPKIINKFGVRSFPFTSFFKLDKNIESILVGAEPLSLFISKINLICKRKKILGLF